MDAAREVLQLVADLPEITQSEVEVSHMTKRQCQECIESAEA